MNEKRVYEEVEELKKLLEEKDNLIRELKEQIRLYQLVQYGKKSEKLTEYDKSQGLLFNEAEDNAFKQEKKEDEGSSPVKIKGYTRKANRNQGRKPIPDHLPREEKVYDIEEEKRICACGEKLTYIGEDESERIQIIPAKVKVIKEIRRKYACKKCEGTTDDSPGVITAAGRKHLIAGGIEDESFIAWSAVEKYEFAIPLYRQAKRLGYIGLPISRATLSNTLINASEKCKILVELMIEHMKAGAIINADESRVQVLKEPGRKARLLSWMWVFAGGLPDKKCVVFEYEPTRSSDFAYNFFKDYSGWLQTDDFISYHTALSRINKADKIQITHVLCWAHCRRKFFDAWKAAKSEYAEKALTYIGRLFELENLRNEISLDDFFIERKKQAELIFKEFQEWLIDLNKTTPPTIALGKAIHYTLDNWEQLIMYVEHPLLTPSNNLAENAIRPFAIGRKNWMFSVTPEGAHTSAILYSLIESAKLNNLIPYDYLYYIFLKLPYTKTREDYIALLPFKLTQETIKAELDRVV